MRRWLLRAALSNLLFLFFLWLYGPGRLFSGGKEGLFLTLYGNCASLSERYFLDNLIFCILPLLLYIYVFSSYFAQDFKTSFVYVFTRSGSRSRWLEKRVASLFLEVGGAVLFLLAVSYIYASFQQGEWRVPLYAVASVWLNSMFTLLPLLLLANVFSLWWGELYGFLLAFALHILSFLAGTALASVEGVNTAVFLLLPTLNGMGLLRGDTELTSVIFPLAGEIQTIPGFELWKSLLVCVVECGLIGFLAARKLRRCDLLSVGKEGR